MDKQVFVSPLHCLVKADPSLFFFLLPFFFLLYAYES